MHRTKIAVVGTGVVGSGVMQAWKYRGFPQVVGYDVSQEIIARHKREGHDVRHMDEFQDSDADLVYICVNTPQSEDGSVNLDYLNSALKTVGEWIKKRTDLYPMIVMRSTTLPTLSRSHIIPLLEEASQSMCGHHFGYAHLPEILRETEALTDSLQIWKVVIGEVDKPTADFLEELFSPVLGTYKESLLSRVPVEVAESAKYVMNVYGATRISFYNSMNHLLTELGIDGQKAIDLASNMGEGALNPLYGTKVGHPYGGMCLPKDTSALLYLARSRGLKLPLLEAAAMVNNFMLDKAKKGQVPHPTKGGFRRLSAEEMRQKAIEVSQRLIKEQEDDGNTTAD